MKAIIFSKIRLNLVFTLLLISISSYTNGQSFSCGTKTDSIYYKLLQSAQQNKTISNGINKCLNKTLSIYVHVVLDSSGKANVNYSELQLSVDALNKAFQPICLSFKVCKIDSIKNWKYNQFKRKPHEDELRVLNYVPKVINWFLVEQIVEPSGANGYAYFPGGPDIIVMQKKAVSLSAQPVYKTVIHETGHFFGLYHTHEDQFGAELVNHSNCISSGDLICDTEADPYPAGTVNPNNCTYSGGKDSNGNWYIPAADNYMSYWPVSCSCRFTRGQYNVMIHSFLTIRNYLW